MRKRLAVLITIALAATAAAPAAADARARVRDRDRDGLPDRWERRHGLSTKKRSGGQDPDRDGLSNRHEYRLRLHPRRADTDRDGVPDGREDADGDGADNLTELRARTDPRNAGRAPPRPDPVDDLGEPPVDAGDGDSPEPVLGQVVSYAAGVVTLRLASGATVRGALGPDSSVTCETPDGSPCSPFSALVSGAGVRNYQLVHTTAGAVFAELALVLSLP